MFQKPARMHLFVVSGDRKSLVFSARRGNHDDEAHYYMNLEDGRVQGPIRLVEEQGSEEDASPVREIDEFLQLHNPPG